MAFNSLDRRAKRDEQIRKQYADNPEIMEKKLKDLRKIRYDDDHRRPTTNKGNHPMIFTPDHAKAIATVMGNMTLAAINDVGCLEAYTALVGYSQRSMAEIWIHIPINGRVEGIKMIRSITGWELKEAKDWLEERDPTGRGGEVGPIIHVTDGGAAVREMLRTIGPSSVNVQIRPGS